MKIKNAKFTMLINGDKTTINIKDSDAAITFVKLELSPEQLCQAMSRLVNVDCEIDVYGLDLVGKKHETKTFEFQLPEKSFYNKKIAWETAQKLCPKGWTPENYFGSQNSFFHNENDEIWARCTIRRWVDKNE
jgi:hypothetical protein